MLATDIRYISAVNDVQQYLGCIKGLEHAANKRRKMFAYWGERGWQVSHETMSAALKLQPASVYQCYA
jgi:hypothetical protein